VNRGTHRVSFRRSQAFVVAGHNATLLAANASVLARPDAEGAGEAVTLGLTSSAASLAI
jgi:hypothetical protein